jgi:transposase
VACDRPYRHAPRIPKPGASGSGEFEAGGDLIKIIWHDGQGACLFTKRLERGRFLWPSLADGVVTISVAQLSYLLSGIDWRMPQATWRPQASG